MREDQKHRYDTSGRWVIAGAVLLGWVLGVFASLPDVLVGFLFAFLAGGIVLNVLELPEELESSFWPFAAGVAGYAVLLAVA